jgi:hypothetical protein
MTASQTIAYRAPLGLQFIDSTSGAGVADGLIVTAWPAGQPWATRTARQSPVSTILGFGRLPGLFAYEFGAIDDPETFTWPPPGPSLPFEVRVIDPVGRYLPELISVPVPVPFPAPVGFCPPVRQPNLVSPALYSAPTRPPRSGFAAVSGEVASTLTSGPASWAVVQVTAGPDSYLTLADELGRYVLYFPYPEALPPLTGSPPSGGSLSQLTWPITVSVNYEPSLQLRLADAATADPPDLCSLLNQGSASIQSGGGTQTNVSATLAFGIRLLLMLTVIPA